MSEWMCFVCPQMLHVTENQETGHRHVCHCEMQWLVPTWRQLLPGVWAPARESLGFVKWGEGKIWPWVTSALFWGLLYLRIDNIPLLLVEHGLFENIKGSIMGNDFGFSTYKNLQLLVIARKYIELCSYYINVAPWFSLMWKIREDKRKGNN